jgi:hypothetical protein
MRHISQRLPKQHLLLLLMVLSQWLWHSLKSCAWCW